MTMFLLPLPALLPPQPDSTHISIRPAPTTDVTRLHLLISRRYLLTYALLGRSGHSAYVLPKKAAVAALFNYYAARSRNLTRLLEHSRGPQKAWHMAVVAAFYQRIQDSSSTYFITPRH